MTCEYARYLSAVVFRVFDNGFGEQAVMQLRIETVFENKIKQDEEYGFPIVVGKVMCGFCLINYDEPLPGRFKIILEGFSPGRV